MMDYALLMDNGAVFESSDLERLERDSSMSHDEFWDTVKRVAVARIRTLQQTRGFLADLRGVAYGDSSVKNQGIMSVSHIADLMRISLEEASLWNTSILAWRLSERQGGGLVI